MASQVLGVVDGSARQHRVWQGALLEVLGELSEVSNTAEGPVSRNLVLIAPERFDVVVGAAAAAAATSAGGGYTAMSKQSDPEAAAVVDEGLFGGGRWALAWLTADGAPLPKVHLDDGTLALEVGWGGDPVRGGWGGGGGGGGKVKEGEETVEEDALRGVGPDA
jgi:hypothetical protein